MLPNTLLFSYALTSIFSSAFAGSVNKGGACNLTDNRLQVGTYQFTGDCDRHTFCAANGTCLVKKCRKDQFPFGYAQDDPGIPPMCKNGQFCPDEEDDCQPVLPVGSACQLNRDDQCEGPPNWRDLADPRFGRNSNGSVCLNNVCYWANVTVGLDCVVENTAYIGYGVNGQEFIDIVSRGNCRTGLYCDSQLKKCMTEKLFGEACTADKECTSMNCMDTQVCGNPADSPKQFGIYVYILVGFGIFGAMFGTLITLFFVHRRQRDQEREKRMQYWREQHAFRQNIIQLRETAQGSALSLALPSGGPNSARSTLSEESHLPILPNANTRGSALRNNLSDDGNESEDYEQAQIVLERENDGKRRPNVF